MIGYFYSKKNQETSMTNIAIKLSKVQNSKAVQLGIKNLSDTCYKVSANQLFLDGSIDNERFKVIDKATKEELVYQGILAKSVPTYIELDAGQEIKSQSLNLNHEYTLESGHAYDVQYKAILSYSPCNMPDDLSMILVESNHIELFNSN